MKITSVMKILIINGHPDKESYCHALAQQYYNGAKERESSVSILHLTELKFNPILEYGYRKRTELEPDLVDAIAKIKEADHIVWIFPMWWYSTPALLKGFIDRTFLPGITFDYEKGKSLPKKLLKGKTARIIITSDTPRWFDFLFMRSPAINQFKRGTLGFTGFKPVKVTYIATLKKSKEAFRKKWLEKVFRLGKNSL